MKFIKQCMFVFIILFIVTDAFAEPSKVITNFMKTPATAFDVFIFQLYEQSKCHSSWFWNAPEEYSPKLCMVTINYNFDDNLIEMTFIVKKSHDMMKGFHAGKDTKRNKILEDILNEVCLIIGVEERVLEKYGLRLGMIQTTPIRHDWGTESFDEVEVRDEIADRTVIRLNANFQGFLYSITRNHNGKITSSKEKI